MTMGLESIRRKARSCARGRISHVPVAAATRKVAGTADAQAPSPGRHQVRLIFSA